MKAQRITPHGAMPPALRYVPPPEPVMVPVPPPKPEPAKFPDPSPVYIHNGKHCPVTIWHCIDAACQLTRHSAGDLPLKYRGIPAVLTREAIVVAARRLTTASYPEIMQAGVWPHEGHSSAITAHQRAKAKWEADAELPACMQARGWAPTARYRDFIEGVVGAARMGAHT